MAKIRLPFNQIPSSSFDAAFNQPNSAATGLPMGVEELARTKAAPALLGTGLPPGVESQAKALASPDTGPQPPMMVNGGMRYAPRMPGTDIGGPPEPPQLAPVLPGSDIGAPKYAPRMPGTEIGEPRNPLGGMDQRPLSARGGPMNYSQKGVGTTNPNSYAVGSSRRDVGTRILERLARRGNAAAAGQLSGQSFQTQQIEGERGFTRERDGVRRVNELEDYGIRRADEVADRTADQTWQTQREEAANQRRSEEYRIRRVDELQDYGRTRADEMADREAESIVGDATLNVQGGIVPAVKTKGGGVRMAGGFIPARESAPDMSKFANDPNLRIKSVDSTGKTTFERVDDKGSEPVIEWVKGEGLTGAQVPYQRMIDPKTGEVTFRKVRVIDADGDGVVSPAEKAAAAAPAASAGAGKAAVIKLSSGSGARKI